MSEAATIGRRLNNRRDSCVGKEIGNLFRLMLKSSAYTHPKPWRTHPGNLMEPSLAHGSGHRSRTPLNNSTTNLQKSCELAAHCCGTHHARSAHFGPARHATTEQYRPAARLDKNRIAGVLNALHQFVSLKRHHLKPAHERRERH